MPGGGTRRDNQKGWYAARAVRPVRPRKFRVTSCGTAGVPVLRASDYGLLSIRALTVLTGWAIEWRRLLAIPRQATLCLLKGPGEAGHRRSEEWPITYIFERYLGSPPAPLPGRVGQAGTSSRGSQKTLTPGLALLSQI